MGVRRTSLILAIALVVVAPAGARPPESLSLHYDIYYRVFPVLAVDVASRVDHDGYRTTVALRTAGVLSIVAPWQSKAMAGGTIEDGILRPAFYRAQSTYRTRRQRIDLAYGRTGAVDGEIDGRLSEGERESVPDWLQDGTVDPITASAFTAQRLAITGTCAGTVPIFDGLRRYDLHYVDLGMTTIPPSRRDPYEGPVRHCRATVHSIAGFLLTGDRAGERATELSAWLAPPVPGAAPVPVRIEVSGTSGTLHAHLASATPASP